MFIVITTQYHSGASDQRLSVSTPLGNYTAHTIQRTFKYSENLPIKELLGEIEPSQVVAELIGDDDRMVE